MKKNNLTVAYIILALLVVGAIVLAIVENQKHKAQQAEMERQVQALQQEAQANALATGIGKTVTSLGKTIVGIFK